MNEQKINQILKNQLKILGLVTNPICRGTDDETEILKKQTFDLLNPPEQQTIADRTHDALCEETEVKKHE